MIYYKGVCFLNGTDSSGRIKNAILSPALVFAAFAVFIFIIYSRVPLMPGDDMIFFNMHLKYGFFDYLGTRYVTWSGRLFSDGLNYFFSGELNAVWCWFATVITVAGSVAIYKWVTFCKEITGAHKYFLALLCCFGFGIINSNVLSPSAFWITGSLYYIIPFELGVIAFTPFVFKIKDPDYKMKKWFMAVSVVCAIATVLSQEQYAVCLFGASVVTLAYILIKTRKLHKFPIVLTAVIAAALVVYIASPGNALRFAGSLGTFPMFDQLHPDVRLSMIGHVGINGLVNQSYMPLMFLWLAIGWVLFKKTRKIPAKVLAVACIVYAGIMFMRFLRLTDTNIFDLYMPAVQSLFDLPFPQDVNGIYIFWTAGLLLVPFSLYFLWGRSWQSLFFILVYVAALASVLASTFTPLVYFSGARTLFLANMLFLLLFIFHFANFKELFKLAVAIVCIACVKLVLFRIMCNNGFPLWYGVLDTTSVPFKVLEQ